MKIKTSELIGPALDWAVAKAEGWLVGRHGEEIIYRPDGRGCCARIEPHPQGNLYIKVDSTALSGYEVAGPYVKDYAPSSRWEQGGPIIERDCIDVTAHEYCSEPPKEPFLWRGLTCLKDEYVEVWGNTPLIAAMRCFVASKLGDEVDVPEELL